MLAYAGFEVLNYFGQFDKHQAYLPMMWCNGNNLVDFKLSIVMFPNSFALKYTLIIWYHSEKFFNNVEFVFIGAN